MSRIVLTVNPGSSSTKTGLFMEQVCLISKEIVHKTGELSGLIDQEAQLELRLGYIRGFLEQAEADGIIQRDSIKLVMGRGGLIGPVKSGVYIIDDQMKYVLRNQIYGSHASNLGALLAEQIGSELGIPSYIADPPSVDELIAVARISGIRTIERSSLFHALNHKAAAREAAGIIGLPYEQLKMIVCHMGGGISVGLHNMGKVVDVNNALEEGPMTPERAGSLPSLPLLVQYTKSNQNYDTFYRLINGRSGLFSYTGSANVKELEQTMEEDPENKSAIDAMVYQICKEIGSLAPIVCGEIDAIVLTGGLARSNYICEQIINRTNFIAQHIRIPGERELQALAAAGIRLLDKEIEPLRYETLSERGADNEAF